MTVCWPIYPAVIRATVAGQVSHEPSEQVRANGVAQVTVGLFVLEAEGYRLNAVGVGRVGTELMRLRCGDAVELVGDLRVRTRIDPNGNPSAVLDVLVQSMQPARAVRLAERASALRAREQAKGTA